MDKGKLQESLTILYLRLNGYFTSGLIVHSPSAQGNRTQVDVLGVRFPRHTQPEREVGSAVELECSEEEVDIVIGEVKSRGEPLQFNTALRESVETLASVLRWVGAFTDTEVHELAEKARCALQPDEIAKPQAPVVEGPRGMRIRGLLFSPEYNTRRGNQPWFLHGPPILNYLWRCLHPEKRRMLSATKYDFGLWGSDLEPLVRYIKGSPNPGTFDGFLEEFKKRVPGTQAQ
jgi:hypothetical protein